MLPHLPQLLPATPSARNALVPRQWVISHQDGEGAEFKEETRAAEHDPWALTDVLASPPKHPMLVRVRRGFRQ